MRTIGIVLFAAVSAAPAAPALAADNPKTIQAMHAFGKCLALRSPKDGAALVAIGHGSKGYQSALKALTAKQAKCASGGTAGFGGAVLPGAVAEELLEFGRSKAQVATIIARKPKAVIKPQNATDAVALCVVRANPSGVADLLATPFSGKEEQAGLKSLTATLNGCAKGKKLGASGSALRAALASAAFRLSRGA